MKHSAAILLVLSITLPASAKRSEYWMGAAVQKAGIVAIVDCRTGPGYKTVITFREILKGDAGLVGESITLPHPRMTDIAWVPDEAKGVAALLKPEWRKEDFPFLEVYNEPEDIQVLPEMVQIYELPKERDRLLAMISHLQDGNNRFTQQIFYDLGTMREPDNFSLITNLFQSADPRTKLKLIDLMDDIGDVRAVPTLISALESTEPEVKKSAAYVLAHAFPGAQGVTEAFHAALGTPDLGEIASQYLLRRSAASRGKAAMQTAKTPLLKAQALLAAGDQAEATRMFFRCAEDQTESIYARLSAAEILSTKLGSPQPDRLRAALLQMFSTPESRDYITDEHFVKLFRRIRHPDCLDALIQLLDQPELSRHDSTEMNTLLAIRELGMGARQKASAILLDRLREMASGKRTINTMNGAIEELLELAWISDPKAYFKLGTALHEANLHDCWKALLPLASNEQEDEGLYLLQLLKDPKGIPSPVLDGIIFRLGDLGERRAVKEIVSYLYRTRWTSAYVPTQALIKIGGDEVRQLSLELLSDEDREFVRPQAMEILWKILTQEESRQLMRRVLREDDFGSKHIALGYLAEIGTPEDLLTIEPLCNFWQSDRTLQRPANYAARAIRSRFSYDLNGPVESSEPSN